MKSIMKIDKLIRKKLHQNRLWRFRNTIALLCSLVIFILLASSPLIDKILEVVGGLGYVGAFIAGIFFVSTFTVAPAGAILFHMAGILHPVEVAVLAGAGAMVGDYIMFRFFKDKIYEEIRPYARKFFKPKLGKVFSQPFFVWTLPLLGAIVVASPLPDEVGISMMGLSNIKKFPFFILSFTLNAIGIFIIATTATII